MNTSEEFDSIFHSIHLVRSLPCASEYLYVLDLVCSQLLFVAYNFDSFKIILAICGSLRVYMNLA